MNNQDILFNTTDKSYSSFRKNIVQHNSTGKFALLPSHLTLTQASDAIPSQSWLVNRGQHRALHFLTESSLRGLSNVEENNRPQG